MDAEDLLLRQFLGVARRRPDAGAAPAWIRSQQRSDGTWATFYEGPPDLSTTVEAYVALRLAGDEPDADAHVDGRGLRARRRRARTIPRASRASGWRCSAQWPWDDLPAMPPEVMLLPPSSPLSIYDFACWARQTIVALTVVAAYRPARALGFGIDELRSGLPPLPAPSLTTAAGHVQRARPRRCTRYERRPVRAAAARRARRPRSGGSSPARRPTARGAASSRRGCTR